MSESETSRSLIARSALLRQIDTESKDTEELRSTVDLSPSTIDRAIRELEGKGYIEQIDGRYRSTLTGQLALESYDRFTTTMDGIRESIDLLTALESDVSLAPAVLANAEVIRAPRGSRAHLERSATMLDEADRIRTVLSKISPQYINLYYEQVMDGINVSVVASASLIEQLITDYYDRLTEVVRTGRVDLRQATEEASFGLTIAESKSETTVELRVYGPDGLRGIIINDTAKAITWANEHYSDAWNDAMPVQTPG